MWIVDSGASSHVCSNTDLLQSTYQLDKPVRIHLPDGSSKRVIHGGTTRLNKDIELTEVLVCTKLYS